MAALGACVLVYLAASARWDERYVRMGAESWLSLAVALILVEILLGPSIVTRALLETRPMVWIGGISYGLYIWHFPVFGYLSFQRFDVSPDQSALSVVAVQCLRFAATFAIAGASFYLVERPAARLRTYIGARPRTDWQQHPVRRGSITEQVERA
jgi:peptidoglycan/LPS O-acetylase OafA/YrhL